MLSYSPGEFKYKMYSDTSLKSDLETLERLVN